MDKIVQTIRKIRNPKKQRQKLRQLGYSKEEISKILKQVKHFTVGYRKFPRAADMEYSPENMAQATGKSVAEYRTWKILRRLGKIHHQIDLCGGIGGDAIAAGFRWPVTVIEKDPAVFKMLVHNVHVYNLDSKIECVQGDILELLQDKTFQITLTEASIIFFDPSRRGHHGRTVKIEEYQPPLSIIQQILPFNSNICVKIAPGVDFDYLDFDCDIEVISSKGEVKEVTLWFGDLKLQTDTRQVIATKLPEKLTLSESFEKYHNSSTIEVSKAGKYLYEPDPAIIKAHLIRKLGNQLNLQFLHSKTAFLTSNQLSDSMWLKRYDILKVIKMQPEKDEFLNFSPSDESQEHIDIPKINQLLSKFGIGSVDFKTRGITLDLREFHKKIHGEGRKKGLVIFTWVQTHKVVIIAKYSIIHSKRK